MAKGAYIGVAGVARKIKKDYIGANGIATITNLVADGSFENVSSNWNVWLAEPTDTSQAKDGTQSLKLGGDALAATQGTISLIAGHKYYGREYIKTAGELTAADCRFELCGAVDGVEKAFVFGWNRGNYPDWTIISNVITVDGSYSDGFGLRTFTVGGSVDAWVDSIVVIDLTAAFGAGKEPSKEWCDANIPFFEGTITVDNPSIVGVARQMKKGYIGVDGVARQFYSSGVTINVTGKGYVELFNKYCYIEIEWKTIADPCTIEVPEGTTVFCRAKLFYRIGDDTWYGGILLNGASVGERYEEWSGDYCDYYYTAKKNATINLYYGKGTIETGSHGIITITEE